MAYLTGSQYTAAATAAFERTARELLGIKRKRDFQLTLQSHDHTAAVSWGWNGKMLVVTLFLPAMKPGAKLTRQDADALSGYWVHEMSHVLYTDRAAWLVALAEGRSFANMVNGLEDIRIERMLIAAATVPGAKRNLTALTERAVWRSPVTPQTVSQKRNVGALLAYLGRERINGYDLPRAADMWAALSPKNAAFLSGVLDRVETASDTWAIVEIVRDLFKAAPQVDAPSPDLPEMPEPDEQNSEAQDGDAQDGDAQDGDAQDGDAQDGGTGTGKNNADAEPTDGAGTGMVDGDDLSTVNTDTDDIDGGDAGGMAQGIADASNGGSLSWDERNLISRGANMRKRALRPLDGWNKRYNFAELKARVSGVGALRQQVRRMVQSPDRFGWINRLDRGRFDPKAVARVRTGSGDYFRKADEQAGHKAAVALLCDLSGSMGSKAFDQAAMCIHLAEAVEAASCPVGVYAFTGGSTLHCAKEPDAPVRKSVERMEALGQAPGSCTPLSKSMARVSDELEAMDGTARILFALTDGHDDHGSDAVRCAIRHAQERGQTVVAVIIGDSEPKSVGFDVADAAITCPDAASLSGAVLKGLADQMERATASRGVAA